MNRITNAAAAFLAVLFVMVLGVAFFEPIIDQIGNLQQSVQGHCQLSSDPDARWAVGENFNNGGFVRNASSNTTNTICRQDMALITASAGTFDIRPFGTQDTSAQIRWNGTAITDQPTTRIIVVAINLLPLILIIAFMMTIWQLFKSKGSKKSGFA